MDGEGDMNRKSWWVLSLFSLLMGCTERGPDEGIVVRSPGDTRITVAEGDDVQVTAAFVDGYEIEAVGCDADLSTSASIVKSEAINLVGEELSLPGGEWCSLTLRLDSSLEIEGESSSGATLTVELPVDELALEGGDGFEVDGQNYILELASPNWITALSLGMDQPNVSMTMGDEHPAYRLMMDALKRSSGLYEDVDSNGELSDAERSESFMAGSQLPDIQQCWVAAGRRSRLTTLSATGDSLLNNEWIESADKFLPFRDLVFTGNHMVALGGDDMDANVAISSNCGEWTEMKLAGDGLGAGVYANDKLVAVGFNGRRVWTTDLVNWNEANEGPNVDYKAIAELNSRYVAVATNATVSISNGGESWSEIPLGGATVLDVAAGDGKFLAVQGTKIIGSASGDSWTEYKNAMIDLTGIAFGGGTFVAVGDGISLASTDGDLNSWAFELQYGIEFNGVSYGNGAFLASAEDGIYRSVDGLEWEKVFDHQDTTPVLLTTGFAAY